MDPSINDANQPYIPFILFILHPFTTHAIAHIHQFHDKFGGLSYLLQVDFVATISTTCCNSNGSSTSTR